HNAPPHLSIHRRVSNGLRSANFFASHNRQVQNSCMATKGSGKETLTISFIFIVVAACGVYGCTSGIQTTKAVGADPKTETIDAATIAREFEFKNRCAAYRSEIDKRFTAYSDFARYALDSVFYSPVINSCAVAYSTSTLDENRKPI